MTFGIPNWIISIVALVMVLLVVVAVPSTLTEEGGLELAVEALELLD